MGQKTELVSVAEGKTWGLYMVYLSELFARLLNIPHCNAEVINTNEGRAGQLQPPIPHPNESNPYRKVLLMACKTHRGSFVFQ